MMPYRKWLPLLVLIPLTTIIGAEEQPSEAERPTLDQLAWLTGSWIGRSGSSEIEEHWITPKSGLMLGLNRTVRESGRTSFEFLRIAETEKGIVYFARPGGREATPFRLVELEERRVVFENPDNEFPQRIVYDRNGDQLRARIEGKIDGRDRAMEWAWRRFNATGSSADSE